MACKRDHERRGITKKGIGAEASPFESAVLPIIAATISQKASMVMVLTAAPGSRAPSTFNSRPPQELWKSLHRCTPLVSVRSQPVARVGPGRWHRGHAARRLTSSPRRPCAPPGSTAAATAGGSATKSATVAVCSSCRAGQHPRPVYLRRHPL